MSMIRKCRECKETLSIDNFGLDRGSLKKLCKKCSVKKQAEYQKTDIGKATLKRNWDNHFKKDPIHARFILSKSAAKQSGHSWELSEEEYRKLNSLPCYYCNGPLPEKGRGLDRIDNNKGYELDNVLPCCSFCNTIRSNILSPEETKAAVSTILQIRNQDIGDPKVALGMSKPRLSLVPGSFLVSLARVMELGSKKYGSWNWREGQIKYSVYIDAAMRHLTQAFDREDFDEESGQYHLAHAAACCALLIDAIDSKVIIDDRPKSIGITKLMKRLEEKDK